MGKRAQRGLCSATCRLSAIAVYVQLWLFLLKKIKDKYPERTISDLFLLNKLMDFSISLNITLKAIGGEGIPVELFKSLKDDAVKVLHSMCQRIWKTHQWPQDWKRSVFIPISKKGSAKEY